MLLLPERFAAAWRAAARLRASSRSCAPLSCFWIVVSLALAVASCACSSSALAVSPAMLPLAVISADWSVEICLATPSIWAVRSSARSVSSA